jgi:predicted Fe-Mo cluster-binding NifX family protein
MKVAFTEWEGKISPVFDASRRLMIADVKGKKIVSVRYEFFNPLNISRLIDILHDFNIDILICGAISKVYTDILEKTGVQLFTFIGGDITKIIYAIVNGEIIVPTFLMPGCRKQLTSNNFNL